MSNSSFYSAEEALPPSSQKSPPKDELPQGKYNPFEVLYDSSEGSSPLKNRRALSHTDEIRHSQIYQDIEYSMSNQMHPSPLRSHNSSKADQILQEPIGSHIIQQSHPIITVVDSPLRRSGSVVSASASLRSRHKIVGRTKIARRKDVGEGSSPVVDEHISPEHSIKKKKRSFLQYPVKRTTSLKRKPPSPDYHSVGQSVPNFTNKSDFDNFIDRCFPKGNGQMLAELLPKQLKFFEFKQLILARRPDLITAWKNVSDTEMATSTCGKPIPPPKAKKPAKVEIIESTKPAIKRTKSKTRPKELRPLLKSILPSRKMKGPPRKKKVTISSPIKESFTHNGVNPYITTTAAAAVAAAAADSNVIPFNSLNKQRDYPLDLDIVTNTDPDSIPMTLDPTSTKVANVNPAQLSPGTIAAVIAAAGMSSLTSSPSPAPTLPPSLSPPVSGNNPYTNFRNELFNSHSLTPVPYATMFPDSETRPFSHLTRKDISQMNRTLFLEILLRRTISAKIDYRLKTSILRRLGSNELDSNDSSSRSEATQAAHDRYKNMPKLSSSEESDTDDDSINTNDLMEHNASLLSSELLPSPQISYSTDLFGNLGAFELPRLDESLQKSQVPVELIKRWTPEPIKTPPRDHQFVDTTIGSSETVEAAIAAAKAAQGNRSRPSSTSGGALLRHYGGLLNSPNIRNRSISSPISNVQYQPTKIEGTRSISTNKVPQQEEMFINDFNKTYFAQYGSKLQGMDNAGEGEDLQSNMYQLKPMNRSAETLSSSEESERAPILQPQSSNETNSHSNSNSNSHSHSHSNSTQMSSNSNSHGTANTTATSGHGKKRSFSSAASIGVMNDLEDMASRISTFMQEELNFPSPQQRPEQLQPLVFSLEISLLQGLSPSSTTKQATPHPITNSTSSLNKEIYHSLKPESTIRWDRNPASVQKSQQHPVTDFSYILRSNSVEVHHSKTPYSVVHQLHPTDIKSLHGSILIAEALAMSEISRSDHEGSITNHSPDQSFRNQPGHRTPQHASNKSFYSSSSRYESSNDF